ncbi:MAG: AmmeMemoRadiSam system protein A [Anaerolineaceae bacterium]|jgi:AmmeMemoRadiSam system protein A|nr:AmmeMemoRadiSam system protein A [Anaerolineaceae bacterium]MDD4043677.1 AmmeMemoRadiSam system protein A [Anaerolineaceae bacterium]MDD4578050.1 AmmeMemoRadiSam system protein A [Anaerolineaceae bacterium]
MPEKLSLDEQKQLLKIARDAVNATALNQPLPKLDPQDYSHKLTERGASFVTLTLDGRLRGCIGTLEAYQPLYLDVQKRAVQAACKDPRFTPVTPDELPRVKIEVSRLSTPQPVEYNHPDELLTLITPGKDGVIISEGYRRATFLPQVWDELPDTKQFLSQLCRKMGCSSSFWEHEKLDVEIYRVEEFSE